MRRLLNTLFVNSEDAYATLEGENVVIRQGEKVAGRFPLHVVEDIYLFSYPGASPALMGKCAEKGINLVFLTPRGKFLARTCGKSQGNVLLRRTQYRVADDPEQSCRIARNFIFGKISNCRQVVERARRDHAMRIDADKFQTVSSQLKDMMSQVLEETSLESLRGLEGSAAILYFGVMDDMILQNKEDFYFRNRNRRPPQDNVNAMLSYVYVMLSSECASALEMVGLDSYVGFMHRDRPGRTSLAQDLMEELRPCMADRLVLTLINDRVVTDSDFEKQENGAVFLTKNGKKKVQEAWHNKNITSIIHPFLKEKIEWGLLPYVQALLLSRYLRGDLDGYPPYLWR